MIVNSIHYNTTNTSFSAKKSPKMTKTVAESIKDKNNNSISKLYKTIEKYDKKEIDKLTYLKDLSKNINEIVNDKKAIDNLKNYEKSFINNLLFEIDEAGIDVSEDCLNNMIKSLYKKEYPLYTIKK